MQGAFPTVESVVPDSSKAWTDEPVPVNGPRRSRGYFDGLDRFDVRRHGNGRELIVLRSPFFYWSNGASFRVPRLEQADGTQMGFVTDGGTIPRVAWSIVGHPFSDLLPAFVLHDYAWSFRTHLRLVFNESNDLLHAACVALGASAPRAWAIYKAVSSLAGRAIWNRGAEHDGDVFYHYTTILKDMAEPCIQIPTIFGCAE